MNNLSHNPEPEVPRTTRLSAYVDVDFKAAIDRSVIDLRKQYGHRFNLRKCMTLAMAEFCQIPLPAEFEAMTDAAA